MKINKYYKISQNYFKNKKNVNDYINAKVSKFKEYYENNKYNNFFEYEEEEKEYLKKENIFLKKKVLSYCFDGLTGTITRSAFEANRELFYKRLEKEGGYLLFMDLDNLKRINSYYTHKEGDRYLINNTIKILNEINDKFGYTYKLPIDFLNNNAKIMDKDLIGFPFSIIRKGGDEFLVILYGEELEEEKIKEMKKRLEDPKFVKNKFFNEKEFKKKEDEEYKLDSYIERISVSYYKIKKGEELDNEKLNEIFTKLSKGVFESKRNFYTNLKKNY